MKIVETELPEVKIIEPDPFMDYRGFFVKVYNKKWFEDNIGNYQFVEEDHSGSYHNVLRGLHYQVNNPQGKFITAGQGEIFDVAVDLRKSSPNFGKWTSVILSEKNKKQIWIPPGFAHGFYTLSPWAEIFYMTTTHYTPPNDRTLIWNDTDVNVNWPIPMDISPIISKKDMSGKSLKEAEVFE